MAEALVLWEERERQRMEILTAVEQAEASLAAGQGVTITAESMADLAADVKRRGCPRTFQEAERTGHGI